MLDRWLPTDESWKNHSWRTVYLVILLTTLLLLLDVLADLMKWFSVSHLIIETLAVVLLVGLLFWLQWQLLRSRGKSGRGRGRLKWQPRKLLISDKPTRLY